MAMRHSDWLNKNTGWPMSRQNFQAQRKLERRKAESQGGSEEAWHIEDEVMSHEPRGCM